MADTLIKMKTGTISKLESKKANGTPVIDLDKGTVYFAVDTTNHLGKIVYDAPDGTNGVDRIVMSTRAEYADQANTAQQIDGVVGINHGGTGGTSAVVARSNLELGNAKIFYGTCSTAAGTTAKVVTCSEFTADDLVIGAIIFVTFTNTNSGAVGSLTLNVNSTGAKSIKKYYKAAVNNLTSKGELIANSTIPFVYNGTYWVALGLDYDTTYNTMTQALADAGTATGGYLIPPKVLYDTITNRLSNTLSDMNAMVYKGTISSATDIKDIHEAGWVYKVATAGTYVGENCEVGDLVICVIDGTTANDNDWIVIQKNIDKALYKGSNSFTDEYMLLADETDGKVKSVAINPTLTLTAGTADAAPKFKITIGGKSSTESSLNTATTGIYGVTKLTSTPSANEESLAATPKLVATAVTNGISGLDVSDTADSTKYVSKVSETNGKIAVTRAAFNPSITVTSGDSTTAPTINVTVAGNSGTAQSLNTATTGVYGVTKLSSASSSSEEGMAATPKGVWTAINTLDAAITGTASASTTLTSFNQTNGKVSATFGNIAIAANQITSGQLAVARGGTGVSSIAEIKAGKDANGNVITSTYATKAELNTLLATADAMIFMGVLTSTNNFPPNPPYDRGWTYKVGAFGTYAGKICEVGDLIICVADKIAGDTTSDDDWMVVNTNLDNGLFKGTNTFLDGQMLLADSTAGKVKAVNINPTVTMTGGTSSAAPKFTISVGGETSSSVSIGTATTGVYGTTKLSSATNSNSEALAATSKAVKAAYDLAASKTDNVGTITGVTAGAGLTGGGTSGAVTIGHSNSITAITTEGLYKIKFDGQGHITGALLQGVTDNSSSTAVTSTDTNLITARTLYYAGYTKNTGTVKSVTLTQGDGITISNSGTAITSTGSRTISHTVPDGASASTYGTANSRTYIQTVTTDQFGHITGITTGSETVTDTHYNAKNIITNSATGKTQTTTALTNGNVYLNLIENNTVRSTHKISGANLIGVTTDSSGNISVAHIVPSNASSGVKGSSGRVYLQTITTDEYGHVTGYTTGTETVTDTHHQAKIITANANNSKTQTTTALTNGNVYLNVIENNTVRSSHKISSSAGLNVVTDTSGNIDIKHAVSTGASATTLNNGGGNRSYIKTITTDAYGHVTGITAGSETVTNTHYQAKNVVANSNTATSTTTTALTNGNVYLNLVEDNTVRSAFKINGSNLVGVTTDASGNISIVHTAPANASSGAKGSSGRTYLQTITTDAYGHVTGYTTASESVTDTHHQAKGIITNSATGKTQTTSALTNGNVYYNIIENNTVRSSHKVSGANVIGVTSDNSGNLSVGHIAPSGASEGSKGSTGRTYLQSITTDAYGHVTGYTTGTETVTNSDTKVNVTLATTTKAYLLGTSTTPTATPQGVTAIADTGVYLDTTAGKLTATSFAGNGASLTSLNATNISSGTLAKERLATSGVTNGTYQGITVDIYGRVTGAVDQGYTTNTGTVTKVIAGTGLNTTADQADSATKGSITTTGTLYLTKSGATEGSYGPSANASPGHSGTFSVPYITIDKYGRVIAASTKTITLPSDNDIKVTNTLGTTTKYYITGTTSATTNTGTQTFDTGVYVTTTAGQINAKTYKVDEAVTLEYNSTTKSLDFIFA